MYYMIVLASTTFEVLLLLTHLHLFCLFLSNNLCCNLYISVDVVSSNVIWFTHTHTLCTSGILSYSTSTLAILAVFHSMSLSHHTPYFISKFISTAVTLHPSNTKFQRFTFILFLCKFRFFVFLKYNFSVIYNYSLLEMFTYKPRCTSLYFINLY